MVWYFIGVYIITRTLHGRLEIQNFSSRVEKNISLVRCAHSKAYSQIRDTFFSKLETKIPDFKSLSHDTLISLLMNSSDYLINCQLVSFISQCFELRTKLISMNE